MTINERVKLVRKDLNLTMEKFGEQIGLKKAAVSVIENGKCSVTEANIRSICREFNVDYTWLTTGTGKMYVDTDQSFFNKIDLIMAGENEFHKNLIKYAVNLDIKELETIQNMINEFLEMNKKKKHEL
ncbi:dNA-binding helix-turn-helix protein [Roseburia sp. CAG:182]|nr:dNA-binding helix-turn-helix protein [Roseburia sp. CAG:182]